MSAMDLFMEILILDGYYFCDTPFLRASGECFATFSNLEMQHSPIPVCNFRQFYFTINTLRDVTPPPNSSYIHNRFLLTRPLRDVTRVCSGSHGQTRAWGARYAKQPIKIIISRWKFNKKYIKISTEINVVNGSGGRYQKWIMNPFQSTKIDKRIILCSNSSDHIKS